MWPWSSATRGDALADREQLVGVLEPVVPAIGPAVAQARRVVRRHEQRPAGEARIGDARPRARAAAHRGMRPLERHGCGLGRALFTVTTAR